MKAFITQFLNVLIWPSCTQIHIEFRDFFSGEISMAPGEKGGRVPLEPTPEFNTTRTLRDRKYLNLILIGFKEF